MGAGVDQYLVPDKNVRIMRRTLQKTIPVNGIVVHSHKLIYFWIPKVGCTSLKKVMADVQGLKYHTPHAAPFTECNVAQLGGFPGYHSFAVVRNPLDRLVSLFRDKIRPGHRAWGFKRGVEDFVLGPYGVFYEDMTFGEFAHKCLSMPLHNANNHWKPQAPQIRDGNRFPDTILRFENFREEVPAFLAGFGIDLKIPRLNPSWNKDKRPWREWYDSELLRKAKQYYSEDINLWYSNLLTE